MLRDGIDNGWARGNAACVGMSLACCLYTVGWTWRCVLPFMFFFYKFIAPQGAHMMSMTNSIAVSSGHSDGLHVIT
jgi:hypothetical protein